MKPASMKPLKRFRGGNASTSIRVVTIVIIVLGAIVTASISLILEDVLPKSHPDEVIVGSRWALLGSSVLLVALAVWLRYEVRSYSGTLFSVQVLDDGLVDRVNEGGTDSRTAANRRYMYLRFIHRRVDYQRSVRAGVIDVHDLCHEVGVTLELLMNTASDESSQTVAPNMPWPVAMAVGAYVPARHVDVRLLELPRTEGEAEHEFPLHYVHELLTKPGPTEVHHLPGVHRNRVGVLATMAERTGHASLGCFRSLGAENVYAVSLMSPDSCDASSRYVEPELESAGRMMAEELIAIKENHPGKELVVAAEVPAAVALSAGWHMTQYTCRIYRDTYLLYHDGSGFMPMRVHPSQPASL